MPRTKVKITCKQWGGDGFFTPSEIRRGGGIFCGKPCYFAYKAEHKFFDRKAYEAKWYQDHKEEKLAKERARRAADPEKYNKISRENSARYRAANPEKIKASQRRQRERDPFGFRARHYQKKYGLSVDFVLSEVEKQNNCCKICKDPFVEHPAVDHGHDTGKYRGMLDRECNRGLGQFRDDPARIFSALLYLVDHKNIPTIS